MKRTLFTIALTACACAAFAQAPAEPARQELNLTVYNSNLAVVRDVRLVDIAKGQSTISLRDVSAQIDPTSVRVVSPSHPGAISVLEQNFEYDLVNQSALLDRYIDKHISVTDDKKNVTEGKLLAADGGQLTLQTDKGIVMLTGGAQQISVPMLPEGLITRPTLVWLMNSGSEHTREPLEVSYQTGGISWHAEYIATLAEDEKSLDLSGWVSIENHSGTSYPDAHLKVVAGSINRAVAPVYSKARENSLRYSNITTDDIEERNFFEYHLYDLGRKTTIANNEVKQISLLIAEGVKAQKVYSYYGGRNVEVSIKFKNTKENGMGMALPMGTVRIMKRDKDGAVELAGEDRIQHTPRDEEVTVKAGNAFDLIGERTVTESRETGPHTSTESAEINLKNRKDEDVIVDVYENLSPNWTITVWSDDYEKKSANQIVFHVPVKARSEHKVRYTVTYSR
ncbi:MAG: DUF4139 domain-containing protein [Bacteroidetes bacterium]|nr:DUF4139 domain-containing protein [Bacteroidota bacterium]